MCELIQVGIIVWVGYIYNIYISSSCCLLFQIKHLKDLEKEKDALWSGLEILEKARLWYLQRLEENRARTGSASYLENTSEVLIVG